MDDEAIPAATLIVVREREGAAPELLIVERAEGMAFAAGALVFPGGRIDRADREAAERLRVDAAAIASIRETIEETAVPVGLAPTPGSDTALELQGALTSGEPFADRRDGGGVEPQPLRRLAVGLVDAAAGKDQRPGGKCHAFGALDQQQLGRTAAAFAHHDQGCCRDRLVGHDRGA
jgi:8-oxo-dGTP pyrophosphatase MutT (NUDIX family)